MNIGIPKNIFIVDEDNTLTKALKDYLTKQNAHNTVHIFHTGEACLKHLSDAPDVIILDYILNHVHKNAANGLQILETIKKHHPDIHVIMLSSQSHYAVAVQTIQKGAEQYVIKGDDAFEKIAEMLSDME